MIRLQVADKPGVLATIAQAFAAQGVSIQTVRQGGAGNDAELVVVTHAASEKALEALVKDLSALEIVRKVESVIRVEGAPS
jgi:homoserine dehydrogenase